MEMETNGTRGIAFNTLKLYKERIIGHPIRYKVLSVRYFINGMMGSVSLNSLNRSKRWFSIYFFANLPKLFIY